MAFWEQKLEIMPWEKIQVLQLEKLKNQLTMIYNNNTYYRYKFDQIGIRPEDINSLMMSPKYLLLVKKTCEIITLWDWYPATGEK